MRYVLQRFVQFLIVFFIVTFGVMVLLRLGLDSPGDPARTMLGGTPPRSSSTATNEKYHLDEQLLRPVLVLAQGMLTGDFGLLRADTTCRSAS